MKKHLASALLFVALLGAGLQAQSPFNQSALTAAITTCVGSATSSCVRLNVQGLTFAALQLSGTFVGTVTFEASVDGQTFVTLSMTPSNSVTTATSATAPGAFNANVAGYSVVQARCSAYTSGTILATLGGH